MVKVLSNVQCHKIIVNFIVGLFCGFTLCYVYLGSFIQTRSPIVLRHSTIENVAHGHDHGRKDHSEDAHDHEALEHAHGPVEEVKFHSGLEPHHKGGLDV